MSNKIDWSKAPKGATHYNPQCGEWYMVDSDCVSYWSYSHRNWLESAHWNARRAFCIARPSTPSWSGEDLPPVGVVCEAAIPHTGGPNNERSFIWIEGSVIAYYEIKGKTYAWFSEGDGFYPPAVLEFRPIRTPEQIAADERDKAAHELFRTAWPETHSWGDLSPHWQEAFYRLADAGYRKP
jgi:hypothetical protein